MSPSAGPVVAFAVACALLATPVARAQLEPPAPVDEEEVEPPPAERLSPAQLFRRGEVRFEYGDCAGAVEALEGISVPGILGDDKELVEAYRILGVCYFQLGRPDDATRSLEALLYIDPEYALDPFRTPPPVTEHFEDLKAAIVRKLREIEEQRQESSDPPVARTLLVDRERVVKTTPFATVFLPFGLSQLSNGEPVKAGIIGGAQGLALLVNVVATLSTVAIDLSDQKIGTAPIRDTVQRQSYSVAQAVSIGALAAFVGAYIYGMADAMWNREEELEVDLREEQREISPEEAKRMQRRLDGE